MSLLAIESSCDESALAWFDPERGLAGEWVHSQIARHQAYGGVVPDLASREHLENFPALLRTALEARGGVPPERLAVTAGPGLAGCLALGIALGKALAVAWEVPLVGVNHLRGHAFSPFIPLHAAAPQTFAAALAAHLPHLGLIVSGGNTLIVSLDEALRLEVLAATVDDAAGEALDKGAKLLGMPYPGGPLIEKLALSGNPEAYDFPRPGARDDSPRFSFSGLKTSLRYRLEALDDATLEVCKADICASYQEAVVQSLAGKTERILRRGGWRSVGLSGGVSNNQRLRTVIQGVARHHHLPCLLAERRHTGDNAGMIAFAAWIDPGGCLDEASIEIRPSWPLG